MESRLKSAFFLLFIIVTILVTVALIRTVSVKKIPIKFPRLFGNDDYIKETRGLSKRLAAACRFQTVTKSAHSFNTRELLQFQDFLEKSFPLVHSTSFVSKEVVNNYSLLYKIIGRNPALKPYLLAGHLDVVPADPSQWDVDPFGGILRNGYIYGRGTIDCKDIVMGILEAVEFLLEKKYQPSRTFYMAFGHDEEAQGYNGAAAIAKRLSHENVQLEYILDEGLFVLEGFIPGINMPTALIGVTEKGYLSVNVSVSCEAGHSSVPPKESAITILAKAISKLEGDVHPNLFGYGPEVKLLEEAAPYATLPYRFLYANIWLFSPLIGWFFGLRPQTSASIRTTTAVTLISGGIKDNVIPGSAWAVVNHRIHPTQSLSDVLEFDRTIMSDERITLSVIEFQKAHPLSPYGSKDFGYQLLKETVQQIYTSSAVLPALTVGNTDTKWYLNLTKAVYRFSPVFMHIRDTVRFHGNNERISVSNYEQVVNFYHHLIINSNREFVDMDYMHEEL